MIKEITTIAEFQTEIASGLKIIDFHAHWCGPCRMLSPLLEDFIEEYPEVDVLKVNVDEAQELAAMFRVQSIPYIVTFVDGQRTGENNGYLPYPMLKKFFKSSLKL